MPNNFFRALSVGDVGIVGNILGRAERPFGALNVPYGHEMLQMGISCAIWDSLVCSRLRPERPPLDEFGQQQGKECQFRNLDLKGKRQGPGSLATRWGPAIGNNQRELVRFCAQCYLMLARNALTLAGKSVQWESATSHTGPADVITAEPPCQRSSMAGRRRPRRSSSRS